MKKKKDIVIVDYGLGNIHSLIKAFLHFDKKVVLTKDPHIIQNSSGIILPGVGAFAAGMRELQARNLVHVIRQAAQEGKPILGICLGAQLLLSEGHEFGVHAGLDIIPGKVLQFDTRKCHEKIPQIGWNLLAAPTGVSWKSTILQPIQSKDQMYFVHSYFLQPEKKENEFAFTNYGGFEFCSVVKKGNIYGCQFHPEKSGKSGLSVIKNFIELVDNI